MTMLGEKNMDIHIRTAKLEDYNAVETIMKQVHQLHVHWRPDVYRQQETILPLEEFEQAIKEQAFFDFLKELKEKKGYDAIELQVNAKNQAAYTMYKNYGFKEKSINMELLEK